MGINLDENGVPFDRELTEEQRERLFEFRALKKELERGDSFVENAEALGLFLEYEEKNVLLLGCGLLILLRRRRIGESPSSTTTAVHSSSSKSGSDNTNDDENKDDNDEDEREHRHHQSDINDVENEQQREHSCFDLETFVKDVAERLHVDDDSIDSETEYKNGNSKGTSSGVSSLDVSHEQQ